MMDDREYNQLMKLRAETRQQRAEIEKLRELLKRAEGAVNDTCSQVIAEYQGFDRKAERLDDGVRKWRADVKAALNGGDDGR